MAVKSPVPSTAINPTFPSSFPEKPASPQASRTFGPSSHMSAGAVNGLLPPQSTLNPTSPSEGTAPNSAISGSSIDTTFTDLTGVTDDKQETSSRPAPHDRIQHTALASRLKSPTEKSPDLKIETLHAQRFSLQNLVNEPQSVIHVPSGFGSFSRSSFPPLRRVQSPPRSPSQRSTSQQSAHSPSTSQPRTDAASVNDSFHNLSETLSSNATITAPPTTDTAAGPKKQMGSQPASPPPIFTQMAATSSERGTPRAQTRSEVSALSRPPSSLASITENEDSGSNKPGEESSDALDPLQRASEFLYENQAEIRALETALSECWTLCNTLAGLSSIHRERIFNFSGKGDMQEQAWKACWKLCQNLYDSREIHSIAYSRPTLDLCREFCLALFEVRARDNETADSVLRVSFELNNHLFNTHDRALPEEFRERTLDFYITLCHRLMKQKARMAEESDSLLRTCWSMAEMLFNLRQNRREGREPDEELLGSAIQSCWELCDIFREGWTSIRPERGTPRPSQTTFTQAFNQARRSAFTQPEEPVRRFLPPTPTTIFEDINTANVASPEEAPHVGFVLPNQPQRLHLDQRQRYQEIPPSAMTTHPPRSLPSADSPMSATTFATDSSVTSSAAGAHPTMRGRGPASLSAGSAGYRSNLPNANTTVQRTWPTYQPSTRSESAAPSETGISIANTSTTRTTNRTATTRTTDTITRQNYAQSQEDPLLTLLKTLFVRAAVQTGQGYNPLSPDSNYSILQHFAKNLPEDAFGILSWQTSLLDNYKSAIAGDPGFQNINAPYLLQRSTDGGHAEVAKVVQRMVKVAYGFGWLRDLFRYVYGVYVEEVMQGAQPVNHQQLPFSSGPGSQKTSGSWTNAPLRSIRSSSGSVGGGPIKAATMAEKLADQASGKRTEGKHLEPVRPGESASASVPMNAEKSQEGNDTNDSDEVQDKRKSQGVGIRAGA